MVAVVLLGIILIAGFLVLASLCAAIDHGDPEIFGVGLMIGLVIGLIPSCILGTSISTHAADLGQIRSGYLTVEVRQQAINDIDEQLQHLPKLDSAMLNGDTPVKSLIEAKAKAISDLADAREKVTEAKIDIAKRKAGLMSKVVDWYGEE